VCAEIQEFEDSIAKTNMIVVLDTVTITRRVGLLSAPMLWLWLGSRTKQREVEHSDEERARDRDDCARKEVKAKKAEKQRKDYKETEDKCGKKRKRLSWRFEWDSPSSTLD